MDQPTKNPLLSKTLWVNVATLVAVAASIFGWDLGLDEETKAEIAVGVIALINVLLRLVTSTKVTFRKEEKAPNA